MDTPHVWVAPPAEAKKMDAADLERLQNIFSNRLNVQRHNDGSAVVQAFSPEDRANLDKIMAELPAFQPQRLQQSQR